MEQSTAAASQGDNPLLFDYLRYISHKLAEIGTLPDNWDGEGGTASPPGAIGVMIGALITVAGNKGIVFPSLCPGDNGAVVATWQAAPQRVTIEVDALGAVMAEATDQDGASLMSGEANDSDLRALGDILAALTMRVEVSNPNWRESL